MAEYARLVLKNANNGLGFYRVGEQIQPPQPIYDPETCVSGANFPLIPTPRFEMDSCFESHGNNLATLSLVYQTLIPTLNATRLST